MICANFDGNLMVENQIISIIDLGTFFFHYLIFKVLDFCWYSHLYIIIMCGVFPSRNGGDCLLSFSEIVFLIVSLFFWASVFSFVRFEWTDFYDFSINLEILNHGILHFYFCNFYLASLISRQHEITQSTFNHATATHNNKLWGRRLPFPPGLVSGHFVCPRFLSIQPMKRKRKRGGRPKPRNISIITTGRSDTIFRQESTVNKNKSYKSSQQLWEKSFQRLEIRTFECATYHRQ